MRDIKLYYKKAYNKPKPADIFIIILVVLAFNVGTYKIADAKGGWTPVFNSQYGTSGTDGGTTMGSCVTCHVQLNGRGGYNAYGRDSKNAGMKQNVVAALIAIETADSDGDSYSSLYEINADTFPGDASSKPSSANSPPVADAGVDQTVQEGALVTLNGSNSSDVDNDIVSYQWNGTAGTSVNLSNASAAQPTFTAPAGGASVTFELTVTDSDNNQDTDTCLVNVIYGNLPPTADAGANQTVDEGDPVTSIMHGRQPTTKARKVIQ